MELRVLGPIEVIEDGERFPLGGPKQRTVLALLYGDEAQGNVSDGGFIVAVVEEEKGRPETHCNTDDCFSGGNPQCNTRTDTATIPTVPGFSRIRSMLGCS